MGENNSSLECAVNNWEYTTKSYIAPKKEVLQILHECIYRVDLSMLLKVHLKVRRDAKSGPLKHECKNALYSAPCAAQARHNRVRLMAPLRMHLRVHLEVHLKGAFRDLNKDVQEGAFAVALKGARELLLHYTYSCTCQCNRVYKIIQ